MISGLDAVKSKRTWFVPDVCWGVSQEATVDFLTVEEVDSVKSVLAGSLPIGSSLQEIAFSDLRDHRGNPLPDTIASPQPGNRCHLSNRAGFTGNRPGHG